LRAVIDVAPRDNVMKIAKEYDDMRAKGVSRDNAGIFSLTLTTFPQIYLGELHGIPLLVKDTIATEPSLGKLTCPDSTDDKAHTAEQEC
jgi:amidase